jgi:glutathione S-transferase
MIHLKEAGLPFKTDTTGFNKAPKGKLPYIREDDGLIVADSSFIRIHLENRYGINFDRSLSPSEKATALAYERLCEEHLYWAIVHDRWINDENFNAGPRNYFNAVPALLRPLVIAKVRRDIRRSLLAQGLGRHTAEERLHLATADIDALAAFLGNKPFLMGDDPCGADASVASCVLNVLCTHFNTPLRAAAEKHQNLVAYRDRCTARWFSE